MPSSKTPRWKGTATRMRSRALTVALMPSFTGAGPTLELWKRRHADPARNLPRFAGDATTCRKNLYASSRFPEGHGKGIKRLIGEQIYVLSF